ncbi:MAG TPA: PepSY-like domain-containing protein [Parasegetibacter sp.]
MKKVFTLLLVTMVFGTLNLSAQIRKIPAAVTEAFKEQYPDATLVEWRDKIAFFQVSFEMAGIAYQANYLPKGEWQSTEMAINETDIPDEVLEGLDKSKYTDWELRSAYKIYLPGNQLNFRLHVVKSELQKKNLLFDRDGRLLKDNITL